MSTEAQGHMVLLFSSNGSAFSQYIFSSSLTKFAIVYVIGNPVAVPKNWE